MQKLNTAEQMRTMDYTAMHGKYGILPAVLMENAGHAVAEHADTHIGGWSGKNVVIFCGKGNNGGDGFVLARHILAAGARVYVYVLGHTQAYSEESRQHLMTLLALEDNESCIVTNCGNGDIDRLLLRRRLQTSQVAVDAMLGTGFHGDLREPLTTIVAMINEIAATGTLTVVAVDIPTGVNADTGAVSGSGEEENGPVFADITVTFGALKRGLLVYPGRTCAGTIELDAIGMPAPLLTQPEEDSAYLLQESDIAEILTPRSPASHKGSHGTIGIVTGSSDMAGAALMAAHGAVRSGAGKVFLRVPAQTAPYCIGRQPEIMVRGIGSHAMFTSEDVSSVLAESASWSVLAMGPGMGRTAETKKFVQQIVQGTTCPLILDADALNVLADEKELLQSRGQRIVITPHLAEFSRLSGIAVSDIQADVIGTAKEFVRKWHVNLVLKGAPTIIVSAKTGNAYVNPTGNAGMACGGMGDVLTGMMAAVVARESHPDICSAACAAVYLHGAAGDWCRKKYGSYGFTPMEVADAVPRVVSTLEENMAMPLLQEHLIGGTQSDEM